MLSDLLEQLNLTGVDVQRDVTGWLGLRAAFSVWLDGAVLAMLEEPMSTLGSPFSPYGSIQPGGSIVEPPIGERRDPTEAELKEIEDLLGKDPADLTEAESKRLEELLGFDPRNPGPVPDHTRQAMSSLGVRTVTIHTRCGPP